MSDPPSDKLAVSAAVFKLFFGRVFLRYSIFWIGLGCFFIGLVGGRWSTSNSESKIVSDDFSKLTEDRDLSHRDLSHRDLSASILPEARERSAPEPTEPSAQRSSDENQILVESINSIKNRQSGLFHQLSQLLAVRGEIRQLLAATEERIAQNQAESLSKYNLENQEALRRIREELEAVKVAAAPVSEVAGVEEEANDHTILAGDQGIDDAIAVSPVSGISPLIRAKRQLKFVNEIQVTTDRPIIVCYWMIACVPCKKKMADMFVYFREHEPETAFDLYLVNSWDPAGRAKFYAQNNFNDAPVDTYVLLDESGAIAESQKVTQTPILHFYKHDPEHGHVRTNEINGYDAAVFHAQLQEALNSVGK